MFIPCAFPPGCDDPAMPDRKLCHPHHILVGGLMASSDDPDLPDRREIEWANAQKFPRTVKIEADQLLRAAYGLLGDGNGDEWGDPDHNEYTRGIAELLADSGIPLPDNDGDRRVAALSLVRASK
jgi:hypothetical protein